MVAGVKYNESKEGKSFGSFLSLCLPSFLFLFSIFYYFLCEFEILIPTVGYVWSGEAPGSKYNIFRCVFTQRDIFIFVYTY